jgi:hypothetical protein
MYEQQTTVAITLNILIGTPSIASAAATITASLRQYGNIVKWTVHQSPCAVSCGCFA